MAIQTLPYSKTGYFSKTICDYLDQAASLKNFYNRMPSLENFEAQMQEKSEQEVCNLDWRRTLSNVLTEQYGNLELGELTHNNLELLKDANTYTITTGHQLNLFSGPLYFLYKIISVINLCEQLKETYSDRNFVPVYWMATEDHDFEEINNFNFKGGKVTWQSDQSGGVGRFSTKELKAMEPTLTSLFGTTNFGEELQQLFNNAYLKHDSLAAATRYFAHNLFKDYGLVIVDGDNPKLKTAFVPFAKNELEQGLSHQEITKTTQALKEAGYPEQVHPREINLFYLKNNIRGRIVAADDRFFVNDTALSFTAAQLNTELEEHPERFSPNALLRPLYQEAILPNLCYIGGGGELAYWLQLKDYFESVAVVFPMLLLRNSALLVTHKQQQKAQKLGLSLEDLFKKQEDLIRHKTNVLSDISLDFSPQREHLKKQFASLYELAKKTDASFLGAVGAQEKKQLNGLDNLEKRLRKAQKRKLKDQLERLTALQDQIFPNKSLQERQVNFSEFYLEYGPELIPQIKNSLSPLSQNFTVITLD